jgi:transposase
MIELSEEQRKELERGYREGATHSYRQRCQMMLLKSEKRTSAEVADILGCCEVSVNNWLKRYQAEGLEGLHTRAGRGRKPILDAEADLEAVKEAVQAHRQQLSVAKAELETALGKNFSTKTLERYIKNTVRVISASESVPFTKQRRKSTG